MNDLSVELTCASCQKEFTVSFSAISGNDVTCPDCGATNTVTEDQIDTAVEKRMKSERKGMKPKFGSM